MIAAGETVAGYDLEELVGRGATGVMFRARDRRLGRRVALRVVDEQVAADPVVRARLNRESTLLAQLDHPNVVPLYAAEEVEGRIVLASRWVDGTSLETLVRREGPLAVGRAMRVVLQAAAALQSAHDLGVIHRDVKPSNVLVANGDHAYLTDFCLARRDTDTVGLTGPNELVASMDYVAPELISEGEVDQRVDIYGLGLVLYEALTGEVPFPRRGDAAKLYAHLSAEPPSLLERRPDVPAELDAVVRRALAKDPADRQPSAAAFAREAYAAIDATPPAWASSPEAAPAPAPGTLGRLSAPRTRPGARTIVKQHPFERAAAADAPPTPPPVPADGAAVASSAPRRRRAGRWVLASLALLLFLAIPAALLLGLRADDAGPNTSAVAPNARDVAVAADRVWVATAEQGALETRPVTGRDARRQVPLRFGDVTGLASRGDRMLVSTERGLVEIAGGDVAGATRTPVRGRIGALATGGGSSWASLADRGELLRLAGGRVARIPLRGPASALAVGAGALWVADEKAGTVFGVDTSTRIARTPKVRVGSRPVALAANRQAVWVILAGDSAVVRLDPRTGRVVGAPTPISGRPNAIAADSRQVWVTRRGEDAVTRLDARTGRPVDEIGTAADPVGVALTDDAAWVVGARGDLTRIPR